jgi:exosome complex component RRP42
MNVNPELVKSIDPIGYQKKFLENGIRSDGRSELDSRRAVNIVPDVISTANGSASCSIGKTSVIVGITAGVFSLPEGIVKSDHEGKIIVNTDLSLCTAERHQAAVRGGCLSDRIQTVLNQIVDNKQLEAKIMKDAMMDNLLRIDSKSDDVIRHVWDLNVSVVVVNDDGALFDASVRAAIAALEKVRLPAVDETLRVVETEEPTKIVLTKKVSPLTVCEYVNAKGKQVLLIDPSKDEESVFPSYKVVVTENGGIVFMVGPDIAPGISSTESPVSFQEMVVKLSLAAKSLF